MTWANRITLGRLGIALACFLCLAAAGPDDVRLVDVATGFFLLGAVTDFLDGYLARRWGEETAFGRMADPLVDKILVCGTLVMLLGFDAARPFLPPWAVVVVILREFVVQGIRSLIEGGGVPFGASFWGKQKMVIQCVATTALLLQMSHPGLGLSGPESLRWAEGFLTALVALMVFATLASGAGYLVAARRLLARAASPEPKNRG